MSCLYPRQAWQLDTGEVVFVERGNVRRSLSLPCQQCIECRLARSREWATRCMHEAQMHDSSYFVTFTYDDDSVPLSLEYRHFQLFMKRLRRALPSQKLRFFMCGEYGERFGRPHYHACIFGLHLSDLKLFSDKRGVKLWTSELLSSTWNKGFVSVGAVTFESAQYVASYIFKKYTGKDADRHYACVDAETGECFQRVPEFVKMSLKPGIGARWFDKFKDDLYNHDHAIVRGSETKVPRYYDKLLRRTDPERLESLEPGRYARALAASRSDGPSVASREAVAKARVKSRSRTL